jgi:hypothetical protein
MVTAERVQQALSARVGRHAMTTKLMFLDALPLTKDLKIDRRRLPTPAQDRPELPNDYVPPATVLEQRIAQVWSEVLEIEPVGVADSLFALGGNSLHATRIVSALHPTCGDSIRLTASSNTRRFGHSPGRWRTTSQPLVLRPPSLLRGLATALPSSAWRAVSRVLTLSTSSGAISGQRAKASRCIPGTFTAEEGLALAAVRGRLMPGGHNPCRERTAPRRRVPLRGAPPAASPPLPRGDGDDEGNEPIGRTSCG